MKNNMNFLATLRRFPAIGELRKASYSTKSHKPPQRPRRPAPNTTATSDHTSTNSRTLPHPLNPRITLKHQDHSQSQSQSQSRYASPNSHSEQQTLSYQSVARRVTLAMTALPIVIVTSYFLFKKVVLGEDGSKVVEEMAKARRKEVEGSDGIGTENVEMKNVEHENG